MNKVEVAFHKGYRVDKDGVLHGIGVELLSIQLNRTGYQYFAIWTGAKQNVIYNHRR